MGKVVELSYDDIILVGGGFPGGFEGFQGWVAGYPWRVGGFMDFPELLEGFPGVTTLWESIMVIELAPCVV